ncbi:MAG: aminotransferase class V-fold PLP-dependent enzyme [Phycisphaera sp.]|nr:aminotransferase class V-fold PLP-dependent enzyme [Phycisphaera sp.]
MPTIEHIRAAFPALDGDTVLLENAGGSQVPAGVVDAIRNHLLYDYCQLGAGYPASDRATDTVDRAHRFMNTFAGGDGIGSTILGSSSTSLMHMLATAIAPSIRPGDEIVVCEQGHEANVGCWLGLEERGAVVRWWTVDPESGSLDLDDLREVLGPRTRIVAFPHVSNLLGEIVDVEAATRLVHEIGGRVVVDGVAFAPHRAIDVEAWKTDFYVWSTYKVFGPHMAAMFGTNAAIAELRGPNHFFIPNDEVPYKFELGGASHEGCAGLCALAPYLGMLAGRDNVDADTCERTTIEDAFETITDLERPVQERILERLDAHRDVRIVGPVDADTDIRVSTISFTHARISAGKISGEAHRLGFGIRNGHMYAHRLCERLGIPLEDGVVRISPVHYNTTSEIDRLFDGLDGFMS